MNTEIETSGLAESTSSLHDEDAGASEGGLRMEGVDAADAGRGDDGPLQPDGSTTQLADPRRLLRFFKKLGIVLLGTAIITFGVHNIHEVTGITEGGVIGFMLFLNKWFGIPSSIASPVLDIICYAVALKLLGGRFLGWSAIATAAVAGFYRVGGAFLPCCRISRGIRSSPRCWAGYSSASASGWWSARAGLPAETMRLPCRSRRSRAGGSAAATCLQTSPSWRSR